MQESGHQPERFTARDRVIAGYAAIAIAVHVLEAGIPSPLPGVKPGLANIIVLLALLRHGISVGIQVSLLRVLVGSLVIGTFMTPTFMLSLAGALASLAVLVAGVQVPRRLLGPIGLAVLAALAHMTAQFLLAWSVFIPHTALLNLLPLLLLAALLSGLATGILAAKLLDRMERIAPTGAGGHAG
ncbi:MAG: Gx transporter family protein [Gammaproteobacteria bacterium]|nr:Gx transporter family protein [Gammaproteobacteria bacterium]